MRSLTEDEFDAMFTPVPDENGEEVRPFDTGLDRESRHLWTVVDADGALYVATGWHFVNRVGYLITEEPWTEDIVDAVWWEPEDDEEFVD